ncbi:hypothetical protein CKO_00960 [Citrobacter koseri ATCC BAA-895]|uniref:Uncharacterized protein n=1 Tax=Citrobacter koseri (strain ATCC BAA-895 / CDC 4225-83 / SGSC4696) TaxID=290338 RepID=A8AF44_CITK8|nr:hypothetical protein CKO_00960 [Citrobacter koseri ATCC BAA-895]
MRPFNRITPINPHLKNRKIHSMAYCYLKTSTISLCTACQCFTNIAK